MLDEMNMTMEREGDKMAENKKSNSRPAHSGFEAPAYGIIVDPKKNPVKYLPNGNINPAWKKLHPEAKNK